MSDLGPFGAGGPFEDLMRSLAQMLTSQGPLNWDIARQLATWTASGGASEPNPDPVARVRLEELLRVAEMHVAAATGLDVSQQGLLKARSVARSEWARETLEAWHPYLDRLAAAMAEDEASAGGRVSDAGPGHGDDESGGPGGIPDPMGQLLGNLPQVLGPFLFGIQAGSMVGELARRAMGQYDLPLPRPVGDELLFVTSAIDDFAREWSLSLDDVRLWFCLREATNHAVLSRPHVRARLEELVESYVSAFDPDPDALEQKLSSFDPTDIGALRSIFGDPSALLGDVQSPAQREVQVPLRSLLTTVTGYVDHVMDRVGRRLVGGYGAITEALRRRRIEEHAGERIVAQLLGVDLDAASYERGEKFMTGVLERAGDEGLRRLWHSERELPTPAELEAPGLWLARIDLPSE